MTFVGVVAVVVLAGTIIVGACCDAQAGAKYVYNKDKKTRPSGEKSRLSWIFGDIHCLHWLLNLMSSTKGEVTDEEKEEIALTEESHGETEKIESTADKTETSDKMTVPAGEKVEPPKTPKAPLVQPKTLTPVGTIQERYVHPKSPIARYEATKKAEIIRESFGTTETPKAFKKEDTIIESQVVPKSLFVRPAAAKKTETVKQSNVIPESPFKTPDAVKKTEAVKQGYIAPKSPIVKADTVKKIEKIKGQYVAPKSHLAKPQGTPKILKPIYESDSAPRPLKTITRNFDTAQQDQKSDGRRLGSQVSVREPPEEPLPSGRRLSATTLNVPHPKPRRRTKKHIHF